MRRDEAPDIRRFAWATVASAKLVALAERVGADPLESGDTALQRLVMVLLAVGTLPLTILWSAIYLAACAPLAAAVPAIYSIATPINTALFAWTRNSSSIVWRVVGRGRRTQSFRGATREAGSILS